MKLVFFVIRVQISDITQLFLSVNPLLVLAVMLVLGWWWKVLLELVRRWKLLMLLLQRDELRRIITWLLVLGFQAVE